MKIRQAKGSHLPGHHDDHREQRHVGEPVDRRGTEEAPHVGEHAVDGVHHHVLPQQRIHCWHDEEGRDQQHPHDAAARKRLVDQQREQHAEHHRDDDHAADQQQGVPRGRPEVGVGHEVVEVLDAGEGVLARLHEVVVDEGEVQRHCERHDHPEEEL
jgi:hypothetical protein